MTSCTSTGSSALPGDTSFFPGISAAVRTATTPGALRTSVRSSRRSVPRATGVTPTAICNVPIGSGVSSIYSALPCTCLAPLSWGSGLCTWRGGASITSLFGGIGEHPAIGDARDLRAHTRDFGERLDDEVTGDAATIGGAGAQIGKRLEIVTDRIGGRLPAARIRKQEAAQFFFDRFGALWRSSHAAERDTRRADTVAIDSHPKSRQHRGNVLVGTLGDLISAEMRPRGKLRHTQTTHVFARPAILLAVVDKEILQRQLAHIVATAQFQGGVERDEHRGDVADRRAVGDAAADGAGRAHLHRAKAAQHFGYVRIDRTQHRHRARERNDGADGEACRAFFDRG